MAEPSPQAGTAVLPPPQPGETLGEATVTASTVFATGPAAWDLSSSSAIEEQTLDPAQIKPDPTSLPPDASVRALPSFSCPILSCESVTATSHRDLTLFQHSQPPAELQADGTKGETPDNLLAMASALPPGWSEAVDENGRTYYQNAATQATQWEPPAWPTSSTALPPGWSEAVDSSREWQLSREDRDRKRKDPLLAAALVSDL